MKTKFHINLQHLRSSSSSRTNRRRRRRRRSPVTNSESTLMFLNLSLPPLLRCSRLFWYNCSYSTSVRCSISRSFSRRRMCASSWLIVMLLSMLTTMWWWWWYWLILLLVEGLLSKHGESRGESSSSGGANEEVAREISFSISCRILHSNISTLCDAVTTRSLCRFIDSRSWYCFRCCCCSDCWNLTCCCSYFRSFPYDWIDTDVTDIVVPIGSVVSVVGGRVGSIPMVVDGSFYDCSWWWLLVMGWDVDW